MLSLVEDLLLSAADDWLDLGFAYSLCMDHESADPERIRLATLEALREALDSDWLVAGEVIGGNFVPWQARQDEAFQRVRHTWLARPAKLGRSAFELVWFAITPARQVLADQVLAREAMG